MKWTSGFPHVLAILFLMSSQLFAQGSAYHFMGGPSLAQQNYEGYNRDPLTTWHIRASVENLSVEDKYALFIQAGLHQRGSAIIIPPFVNQAGMNVNPDNINWRFNNLALVLGGKQKFGGQVSGPRWFYGVGVRGEYNLSTSFDDQLRLFPDLDEQTNSLLFGVTASIGAELMFSELVGGVIELQVHPDLSDQMLVPAQRRVDGNGFLPERRVRNLTIELSVGIRLLRIVNYVD